ncbi:hypothetical protein PG996_008744 [Apiospora saccharicola]|uniref:DUF7580 domain-containing protein n=1 Tax=Apiospora saccharicola TaxID=335842 RepID=A0ABR1UYU7_9PEZI
MATGFEITGVVLGAIPLIIEGIKIYREAAGKTTREGYLRRLRILSVELETEQTILRNTYNSILCDIKATEGPDMNQEIWKEGGALQQRVYERLGASADSFKATAQNMDAVIRELMMKLGLSPGRKIDTSLLSRLKAAWNGSEYDDLIARLRISNQQLSELARQTADLSPKMRSRSQSAIIGLTRELLKNVYNALNSSIRCTCPNRHGVNLQIESYPPSLLRHGDEDKATENILIHAILSFDPSGRNDQATSWQWEEVRIQKSSRDPFETKDSASIQLTRPRPLQKKVASKSSATGALVEMGSLGAVIGKPCYDVVMDDLCQKLGIHQSQPPQDAYGLVVDRASPNNNRFKVSSLLKPQSNDWTPVSLKQVLEHRGVHMGLPHLAFKHKVKLAPILARTVLQLPACTWLPHRLTSDQIVFIQRDSSRILYESVYVLKHLPERPNTSNQPSEQMFDLPPYFSEIQKLFFSLGVLLMEVVLGFPWEIIRASSTASSDLAAAEECLARVQNEGENYFLAIRCCIKFQFEFDEDLDKAQFREEVYEKVVGRLEGNVS